MEIDFDHLKKLLDKTEDDSTFRLFIESVPHTPVLTKTILESVYCFYGLGFELCVHARTSRIYNISLYRGGLDGFADVYGPFEMFRGGLPHDVTLHDTRIDVRHKLGTPMNSGFERRPQSVDTNMPDEWQIHQVSKYPKEKTVEWDEYIISKVSFRFSFNMADNGKLYRVDISPHKLTIV